MATDEEMYDADHPSSDADHPASDADHPSSADNNSPHSSNNNAADTSLDQPPVYIPEDVVLPPEFELRESRIEEAGLGVFSLLDIPTGEKFGPFVGEERSIPKDTQYAWEIVDDTGKVKCWIDASQPGTGNWMKYVRSAPHMDEQNMVPVQVDNKVFYKVIRPIQPGEELMVLKEAAFPDQEGIPFQLIEEQQYDCPDCQEVFRSKVGLRRHQKYACRNLDHTRLYSNMNQQAVLQQQQQNGCNNNTSIPGAPLMPVMKHMDDDNDDIDDMMHDDSMPEDSGSDGAETPPPDHANIAEEDYSENRQFKCTECPRSFNWKSNLIRHMSDHENDRYFPCENCDKSFSDPSNLQRHIRTQHVGARSHACPECGKTFATSSGLKQHTHIHSSIKPFTCEVCLKSYTQFSNLCRHKRMHADCRTQLKCSTCGQMFATITSLNKHRRFCHGSSHVLNGQQHPVLPIQQGLRSTNGLVGGAIPSATSPNMMPMGVLPPTSSALHPANLAQLYNMQLTQQAALLQNNLLAYSGDKSAPIGAHPYLMGYPPHLANHTPLLATGLANANGLLKPSMSPNQSTEEWLKHYTAVTSPNRNNKLDLGSENEKLKKLEGSDMSDAGSDIDNVSTPTGSDLDSTSGSDLDSENDDNERSTKRKEKGHKYGQNKLNGEKLEKSLYNPSETGPSEPIKAIASIAEKYFGGALPPGMITPHMVSPRIIPTMPSNGIPLHKIKEEALPRSHEGAFDLSKSSVKSPQVSPVVRTTRDDQPLDLSMPSKKREPEDEVKKERSDAEEVHAKPIIINGADHEKALQQHLHMAYSKQIPFNMDPIYRVSNGFPMMHHKFMRMDYASQEMMLQQAHAAATFAGLRKFEQYDPSKISPVMATKPTASPPQRGAFTVNSLLYANSADKMVIRSKDRYTCKFCGKLFPRSANLTRHLRTHTGEQPYSCKYCDRSFSISSNLQRHVRNIHNKEKPFKCPLCDRCFGQQTNLDRHLKKHENERNEEACSLSPITPIKDDLLANKLKEAKLNGSTPLPPTINLSLEEKDESYFDEIKNFITNKSRAALLGKELLHDIHPILPRQVQSPSVGSSSPDGPKKGEQDSLPVKHLPITKLEVMDTARQSPSPRPLEVDESRGDSDDNSMTTPPPQDVVMTEAIARKRASPSPLPSPPMSPEDKIIAGDDDQEPINKRPRLQDDIGALKSFCPSPPAESSEMLDGRENLTRHSKMQAYSLMMTQYDEDHHERRRQQQLHSHPAHAATAV